MLAELDLVFLNLDNLVRVVDAVDKGGWMVGKGRGYQKWVW